MIWLWADRSWLLRSFGEFSWMKYWIFFYDLRCSWFGLSWRNRGSIFGVVCLWNRNKQEKSQILSQNSLFPSQNSNWDIPGCCWTIPACSFSHFTHQSYGIIPILVFIIDIVPLGQAWIDAGNAVDFRSTLTRIIFGIVAALMAF